MNCTQCNNSFILTGNGEVITCKEDLDDKSNQCKDCTEQTKTECLKILVSLGNDIYEKKYHDYSKDKEEPKEEWKVRNKRRGKKKFKSVTK